MIFCYICQDGRYKPRHFLGHDNLRMCLFYEIWPCCMAAKKKSAPLRGRHSSHPLLERFITLAHSSSTGKLVRFLSCQVTKSTKLPAPCECWVLESRSDSMELSGSPDVRVCSICHSKISKTGGLNHRIVFPHSSGAWKSAIKGQHA